MITPDSALIGEAKFYFKWTISGLVSSFSAAERTESGRKRLYNVFFLLYSHETDASIRE